MSSVEDEKGDVLIDGRARRALGIMIVFAATLAAVYSLYVFQSSIPLAYASNQVAPNVIATATVPSSCAISLSPTGGFTFASQAPGTNTVTTPNSIVDTNGGNVGTFAWIYGSNWVGGASSFGVRNTTWSGASTTGYGSANALTTTTANTGLVVASGGGTATIYFGVGVPVGQAANTYTQNIVITNVC